MQPRTRAGAFRALVRADARELRRDRLVSLSMLTMALVLVILHSCMWLAFSVAGAAPRVDTTGLGGPTAARIDAALDAAELRVDQADAAPNTRVSGGAAGEHILVAVTEPRVGWDPVWRALRTAGVPAGEIDVVGRDDLPMPDFLRLNLGTILVAALASIALLGTTVPLVAARGRGTLQLLGTTPLPRGLFLLSRVPNRLGLVLVSVCGVIAIAFARQTIEAAALPRLLITVLCALVLLFGLAALFASRAAQPEASQALMTGVCFALVMSAGSVLPVALLPEPVRIASGILPGGWLVESLAADLAGMPPLLPVPVYWALMLLAGLGCGVAAARRFSWAASHTHPRAEEAHT